MVYSKFSYHIDLYACDISSLHFNGLTICQEEPVGDKIIYP